MTAPTEREQQWTAAANEAMDAARPLGLAMMAVADAEQAELRAEVEDLTHRVAKAEGSRDMVLDAAKSRGARAEVAEAKVARVEALADEWDRSRNPILHVAAGRLRTELRKRSH